MLRFILARALLALLVVFTVSVLGFLLLFASGDPAIGLTGETGSAADAERVRAIYGLGDPVPVQYGRWLGSLLQGDMGRSLYFESPVAPILGRALQITFELGTIAIVIALALGITLGVASAWKSGSWIDRAAVALSILGQAMPAFWLALMFVVYFSVRNQWLPSSGLDDWKGYVLPTTVLATVAMPGIMRLTRAGMLDVLGSDYIRTARAMGIGTRRLLFAYALRNALLPVVSLASAQFSYLLAGSVVVESVFAIDGVGRLAWQSILRSDMAMVQALVVCLSTITVALTTASELLGAWLDPRLRDGGTR